MIVDTDALISLTQGDEGAVRTVGALEEEVATLAISSVSLFELHHSLERVRNPERKRREIDSVLDTKQTFPADGTVMKKAGRIDGRLASEGRAIGIADTIIGATALVHEQPVLTRNVDHFQRIDGLEMETY